MPHKNIKFEQVQSIPDLSFHFEHYREPVGLPMPYHIHPEMEFDYVVRGQGYRMMGNEMLAFSNDEVAFIPSQLPHCLVHENQRTDFKPDHSENLVLQVNPTFLSQVLFQIPEFKLLINEIINIKQGVIFTGKTAEKIKSILFQIDESTELKRIGLFIDLLTCFENTGDMKFIGQEAVYSNTIHKDKKRIEKAYRYILENYQNKILLHDVANVASMSDTAFSTFFSKTVRKSFSTFLLEYRIERACKLLRESNLSISDICFAVGFGDIPYFNRTFKKTMGESPSKYRTTYHKMAL